MRIAGKRGRRAVGGDQSSEEKTPAASQPGSRCFALKIRREHEKEKEKNKKATEKLLPKEKSH